MAAPAAAQPIAEVLDATPGVRFTRPVGVEMAPGQWERLYVIEQGGGGDPSRVLTLEPGDDEPTVFLDLDGKTVAGGEAGLLGLAFHPDYDTNGRLFVSYTAPVASPVVGQRVMVSRVSEFARSAEDPFRADPASERVLLEVDQPETNHNGGTVDFGPDGYLYVGLGDGGGQGDRYENGQDPTTLLGAILRIDVDDVPEGAAYGIPEDNPFAQTDGPERDEIYAYGFRNPFKFDAGPGGLWVGDVGEGRWEEVDRVEAGGNYGWNQVEGPECFQAGCDLGAYEPPVVAYAHDAEGGVSITGGFVVYVTDLALSFHYVYGDFGSGRLWALPDGGGDPFILAETFPDFDGGRRTINISSIDPGALGSDVLVTDYTSGTIYQLVSAGTPTEAGPARDRLALELTGPNPTPARTAFRVETEGPVRVSVFDVRGREVAVLWDGPAPRAPLVLDAAEWAPGVYTVVARGEGGTAVRRVVVAR